MQSEKMQDKNAGDFKREQKLLFRIKRIRRQFAAAERAQSWRRMRRYSHVAECDSRGREWGDGGGFGRSYPAAHDESGLRDVVAGRVGRDLIVLVRVHLK
jgi:hypothetical protein